MTSGSGEKDDWEQWWDARLAAMESILGPADAMVGHATVSFDLGADIGGAADLVYFRGFIDGVVSVTSELIGRDDQIPSALENYELAICHRTDDDWGSQAISRLAHYTLRAALNPGETMDFATAVPDGSTISAFLFLEFARFEVRGRKAGILLCLGITQEELAACRRGETDQVEKALRTCGVYPYTDLHRETAYRPKRRGLF